MKKILPLGLFLFASVAIAQNSSIPSQVFYGERINSISNNGLWMVSELDMDKSLLIRNLETGEDWKYEWDGSDFGVYYDVAMTKGASDIGVITAEVGGIPSYWVNGKWTRLDGADGNVAAIVGGITPDASMIVGAVGDAASMFEDKQMTYPCYWTRNDDGTYTGPVFLPSIGKDFFGMNPMYVQATSVSDDGKTIGVTMRSGSGFFHLPYVYTLGDDGVWTFKMLGMDMINPTGREITPFPGEYEGPSYPNYEEYLSPSELAALFAAGPEWIDEQIALGLNEEEIALAELTFAMEFMSEENKALYEPLLKEFLEQYVPWQENWKVYETLLEALFREGYDFLFNNVYVSPDGKYLYTSATSPRGNTSPVRFDVATGEHQTFAGARSIIVCGVTDDYSVLGNDFGSEDGMAYIYPQNSFTPVNFVEYWENQGNLYAYDWMEENMFVQVVTSINESGGFQLGDKWSVGRPIATPDMSLIGYGTSSVYWYPAPDENSFYLTCLLNPNGEDITSVETVEGDSSAVINCLAGGQIEIKGEVTAFEIYDLSGKKVYASGKASGVVSTMLPGGIYILKAIDANGDKLTRKILF